MAVAVLWRKLFDRDGIANRYDRHPNRPDTVRYDRDRDGAPNAHDRRPDDARRH